MSVINTMLKDLERRGVEYTNSDDAILSGLEPSRSSDDDTRMASPLIISLASVFLVIAVLGIGYYVSPYQLVSDGAPQNKIAELNAAEPPVTVVQAKTPAQTVPQTPVATPAVKPEPKPVVVARVSEPAPVAAVKTTPVEPPKPVEQAPRVITAEPEPEADMYEEEQPLAAYADQISKKQLAFSAEEKSQQAYAEALAFYDTGSRQSAKASLQQAIEYSATNAEARRLLVSIHLEDGKPEVALEVIEAGLTRNNNDQPLLRQYLQAHVQLGHYNEAIALMEQRLQLTPPEDFGYLAALYQKNNDHVSAVKMYARALQLKPSNSIWWMGQGISFEVMQDYDEAIKSYQQSISTGRLSGKLAQYAITRINSIKQLNGDPVS